MHSSINLRWRKKEIGRRQREEKRTAKDEARAEARRKIEEVGMNLMRIVLIIQ
jgi:hypothetical protein